MKKLLAVSLVVIMVFAMFVPATVTAAGETADERGTLVFEEDFNQQGEAATTRAQQLLSSAIDAGNKPSAVGENFNIENGMLNVNIAQTYHERTAMRIPLYDIPNDGSVDQYSIEAKFKVTTCTEQGDAAQYSALGLIYEDDGQKKDNSTKGAFYMFAAEHYYAMRLLGWNKTNTRYVVDSEGQVKTPKSEMITVKCTVDMNTTAVSVSVYKADGTLHTTVNGNLQGLDNNVGLFLNDTGANIDYVKVYTKSSVVEEVEETLVFEENFKDASKINAWKEAVRGKTEALISNEDNFKIVDNEKLYMKTTGGHSGTFDAPRLLLWTVPDSAETFTVTMKFSGAQTNLIIADNGVAGLTAFDFQMFWTRPGTTSGTASYKNGDNQDKTYRLDMVNSCPASDSYIVTISVDLRTGSGKATLQIEDSNGGYEPVEGINERTFLYKSSLTPTIGIMCNNTESYVDYVKVYASGVSVTNEETTFTGTRALVGDMYGLKYNVAVADKDVNANNKITATFTMNGKTTDPVAVTNGFVEFYGIASQCMGDTITAKLYCDSVEVDSVNYTVAENLQTLAATNNELARAALVYGAASQEYKNYGTPVTNVGVISFDKEDLTPTKNVVGGNDDVKFTGVGVYFDDTNKLYYLIDAPNGLDGVTVKINGEARNIKHVEGTTYKVYSEELYANELLRTMVATIEVSGVEVHKLTYGVVDYVLAKCESTTPGLANLVKALYNYAVAAMEM